MRTKRECSLSCRSEDTSSLRRTVVFNIQGRAKLPTALLLYDLQHRCAILPLGLMRSLYRQKYKNHSTPRWSSPHLGANRLCTKSLDRALLCATSVYSVVDESRAKNTPQRHRVHRGCTEKSQNQDF